MIHFTPDSQESLSDFEKACNVITTERSNRWDKEEHLGRSFYRLALLKQLINAIDKIIEKVYSGSGLAMLHNILGDLHWRAGKIKQAVLHHEKAKSLSDEFEFKWLSLASLQNLAICKMELLEVEEAVDLFDYVSKATQNTKLHRASVACRIYLAFLNSLSASSIKQQEASKLVIEAWQDFPNTNLTAQQKGYGYIYLGLTYKNLKQINESIEMYRKAILFAEESYYTQVKAKALTGLSELYRLKGEFKISILNNLKSIELLDNVGAMKDLAEAYFQIGLTYQKMGAIESSDQNFQEAIRLFIEMEAPKQVERVRQSMQSSQ